MLPNPENKQPHEMSAVYLDHMGTDFCVADAARVSFAKRASTFTDEQNTGLINWLADHKHMTPFQHIYVKFRMRAPVPIRTHCFKSKVGLTENEESRRYIKSRPELFVPEYFRQAPDGSIKQGSAGKHPDSDKWIRQYIMRCEEAIDEYEYMLHDGIAPEQARFVLPQGCQVNWIWSGSLAAFARFYMLRTDKHAQQEVRDLAFEVGDICREVFPIAWNALVGDA